MNKTRFYPRLDFDALSLIPQVSEIFAEAVEINFTFASKECRYCPLIPSPMDSVISPALSLEVFRLGGVVTLPTVGWNIDQWRDHYSLALQAPRASALLGILVPPEPAVIDKWLERWGDSIDFVALDTLHFRPDLHLTAIKYLKANNVHLPVISGNVIEKEGARRVIDAGADAVRVGMTSASINQGKALTGCARSQLAAVFDCAKPCGDAGVALICDGGISSPDRAVKAFALGANAVMMGAAFAATAESAAPMVKIDGHAYKRYAGMSQVDKISAELIAEGTEHLLKPTGTAEMLIQRWMSICRIAIARAGAASISQLHSISMFEVDALMEKWR